jgi:Uma2 family endonuclease
MTEPARRALHREDGLTASTSRQESEPERTMLLRWVEGPDGRMELLEIPLTREDYLNPRFGDKWVQGRVHSDLIVDIGARLLHWSRSRPEFLVISDVQHVLGRGLPKPSPDISVIRGARNPEKVESSYNMVRQGVPPCLIIELISPRDPRIREIDEHDKVDLYQRIGVREYFLVELPRTMPGRFGIFGYRLDSNGTYRRIVPDAEGGLCSETTGLWFGISPEGTGLIVRDAATGEPLPNVSEAVEALKHEAAAREAAEAKAGAAEAKADAAEAKAGAAEAKADAAEAKAAAEAEARQAAEDELARLRSEIERLRSGP